MNSNNSIEKLKELREMVNRSFNITNQQLQNIKEDNKFGNQISLILSLILTLGISLKLNILVYWIPSSFLLMYLLGLIGIFLMRNTYTPHNIETNLNDYKKTNKNILNFICTWVFKFISPFMISISVIHICTFIILLLIENNTLTTNQSFPIFIPIITSILFVPSFIYIDKMIEFFESNKAHSYLNILVAMKESEETSNWYRFLNYFKLILLLIFMPLILILPLLALFLTYSIIADFKFLIIILVFQLFIIIISVSHFSSLSVKKELINTLRNYADINIQIDNLILHKEIKKEYVEYLKNLYLTAKQYDVLVISLKFDNLYILFINQVFLNNILSISNEKREN